jgi:hypothetical protein
MRKKLFTMICQACQAEHDYFNPKQFSSWIRRHRQKVHADLRGRIAFKRKDTPGVFAPLVPMIKQ